MSLPSGPKMGDVCFYLNPCLGVCHLLSKGTLSWTGRQGSPRAHHRHCSLCSEPIPSTAHPKHSSPQAQCTPSTVHPKHSTPQAQHTPSIAHHAHWSVTKKSALFCSSYTASPSLKDTRSCFGRKKSNWQKRCGPPWILRQARWRSGP